MAVHYPYNFFKTDKNLSLEQISSIASIPILNTSILKNYEVNINDFIRGPKKNMPSAMILKKMDELKKFRTLELISNNIFDIFLKNNKNIFLFSKEIILVKYRLREYINSIKEFLKLKDQKLFSSYLIHTYKDNLSYKNPITFANIHELDRNYIIDKIYVDYDKNKKKLQKLLDIMFHGDYINLSLPSMGAMSSDIEDSSSTTTKNFVNFIYELLKYFSELDSAAINNNSKFILNLPITELEISKIIARKLVNENNMNNKLNLPDNFSLSTSNTNSDIVKLIENNINGIDVKLKELMFDVKTKKIKPEFLIPYKIDKDKIDPTKEIITELKKSETSSKLKNLKETMKHNLNIFYYVASKVFTSPNGIKSMNEPNYKNVLACLLFIIINIVYEFQKEYIKNVNNILIDLTQTSNKKFGKLNIENGFEFIELLNKSLYKFKLVLFNNFYHLFTPGKIQNTIYGMKKNEAGCYKPDARFLSDNQYILDNYPFNSTTGTEVLPSTVPKVYTSIKFSDTKPDKNRLAKFLTTIKSKYDIYDKNDTVELGGFAFGQDITMEGFNMITNFYKLYYENCNFSIFTIDLLFKNFTDDKKIIIELFSDIISKIPTMRGIAYLPKEEKDRFEYILTKEYSDALTNATKLLVKLNSIVQKIKLNKKTNNNNSEYSGNNTLFKEREILKISSTLYYFKSIGIDTICKNYVSDVKLKNKLITKFGEIKRDNEKILAQYK